jgi:iron complex transport system substrate-binding protein
MAGGMNISGELEGDWITVDSEWIIMENPDIIVREVLPHVSGWDVIGYDAKSLSAVETIWEGIVKKSALETTNAVKNKKVFIINANLEHCLWFIGLHYIAKWYHPELFADLDPQAVHQEYITKFQRIDYDLQKQGVFAYPEP